MSSTNLLGNLNQVCIATPDFDKTLDELGSVGLGPFQVYHFNSETVSDQQYYEKPVSYEMDVAFAYNPDATAPVLEVMHPKKGKSVIQDYLNKHGKKEGVQSIAYDMSTLTMDQRIAEMKKKGYKPATSGCFIGKNGWTKFCFFDTADNDRVPTCFETIEWSSDWEAPDPEWYTPKPPRA